jgi:hypothetical protein
METTATYVPETREFVINTPTTLAQKYWVLMSVPYYRSRTVLFMQSLLLCLPRHLYTGNKKESTLLSFQFAGMI